MTIFRIKPEYSKNSKTQKWQNWDAENFHTKIIKFTSGLARIGTTYLTASISGQSEIYTTSLPEQQCVMFDQKYYEKYL